MCVQQVMDRLVANRGRFVDENGREVRTAQFFATHRCPEGVRLVLLTNDEVCVMRELSLTPDGQVVLKQDVVDRMRVRRGRMTPAIYSYNEEGRGKLSDVWVL